MIEKEAFENFGNIVEIINWAVVRTISSTC